MLAQEVLQFYASGNQLDPVGRMGEVIGSGGGAYPVWTNHREGRVVGTPVRFLHHRSSTLALRVVGQADKQEKSNAESVVSSLTDWDRDSR